MAKVTLLQHKYPISHSGWPLKIGQIRVHSPSDTEQDHPSEKQAALRGNCHPVTEILKAEMVRYGQYRKQRNRERPQQRRRGRDRKQGRRQQLRRRRTRGTVFQAEWWKDCHRIRLSERSWWNYNAAGTILRPEMETSFWLKDNASLRENGFKILAVEPIWKLERSHWLQP